MTSQNSTTIRELADVLKVTNASVYRWLKTGKLKIIRQGNPIQIPFEGNSQFISEQLHKSRKRSPEAWTPREIKEYSEWHELVDELSWLVKIYYSPIDDIKRKRFRLDQLFTNYLAVHEISLQKVAQAFASKNQSKPGTVTDDLKRGWYNELAYVVPLRKSTLGLSFSDIEINKEGSSTRFAFPSWRITTAYYAVYFYLRGPTLQKQTQLRLQEHGATIQSFKNNLLRPLSRVLWKFPFDISYIPHAPAEKAASPLSKLRHTRFQYALHPREPHRSPVQIVKHITAVFAKKSRRKGNASIYTLFDYLHDFRIWANYLDIDNLLSLWGPGYKSFIDQNLSLLVFFIGGIAEVCYLAVSGEKQYLRQLQSFYDLFVTNNPELGNFFANTPIYQRLMIYKSLGLVNGNISLKQEDNINRIIVQPNIL